MANESWSDLAGIMERVEENEELRYKLKLVEEQKRLLWEINIKNIEFYKLRPFDENFAKCNKRLIEEGFRLVDCNKLFVDDIKSEIEFYRNLLEGRDLKYIECPRSITKEEGETPILSSMSEARWYKEELKRQAKDHDLEYEEYARGDESKTNLEEKGNAFEV